MDLQEIGTPDQRMTDFPSPRTTSPMTPRPFARHSVGRNTWPDKNVYLDRRAVIPVALGIIFRLFDPTFLSRVGISNAETASTHCYPTTHSGV
jgi:hypothetical protein